MGIFDNYEERERIRKRAEESERKYEQENKVNVPEEKGIEELDLEDAVPGGSYAAAVTPVGMGRSLLRKLGKEAMEVSARAGAQAGAKKGAKLAKLREDGLPPEVANKYARPEYDIKSEPGVIKYTEKRRN